MLKAEEIQEEKVQRKHGSDRYVGALELAWWHNKEEAMEMGWIDERENRHSTQIA